MHEIVNKVLVVISLFIYLHVKRILLFLVIAEINATHGLEEHRFVDGCVCVCRGDIFIT